MKRQVVWIALPLAIALAGCEPTKQARQEAPPRPVLVATVHYQPRERAQALPGTIKARTESELGFRVGGRLDVRLVDAGAFVRKGEPHGLDSQAETQRIAIVGFEVGGHVEGGQLLGREDGLMHAPGLEYPCRRA